MEEFLAMNDERKFKALHLRRQHWNMRQYNGFSGLAIEYAPTGGLTILYRRVTENVLQYTIARCSLEDRYNRKIGRAVAMSKLVKGEGRLLLLEDVETLAKEPPSRNRKAIAALQKLVRGDKQLLRNLRVTQARSGAAK